LELEVNILLTKDTVLERELIATVRAGLFHTEEEALAEALGTFFAVKPHYRQEAAIEMFKDGELSLSRAAKIAGMNRWRFQELLVSRGIKIEIEVDEADARTQSEAIRSKYLDTARKNNSEVKDMKHNFFWTIILTTFLIIGLYGCDDTTNPIVPDDEDTTPVGIELGNLAPDFTLESATGEQITLSDYKDEKNVVLYFYSGSS